MANDCMDVTELDPGAVALTSIAGGSFEDGDGG
jgi:hypothetical protein